MLGWWMGAEDCEVGGNANIVFDDKLPRCAVSSTAGYAAGAPAGVVARAGRQCTPPGYATVTPVGVVARAGSQCAQPDSAAGATAKQSSSNQ